MTAVVNHSTRTRRAVPWRPNDAVGAAALNVVGFLVVVGGWMGVSGTAELSHQFAWTTVAVGGLVLAAYGNAIWLLAGRRSVGLRRRQLLTDSLGMADRVVLPLDSPDTTREIEVAFDKTDRVTAPGMTRYHKPGCMLARGKDNLVTHTPGASLSSDLGPCAVCQP